MRHRHTWVTLLAVLTLVASGCGKKKRAGTPGDDESHDPEATSVESEAEQPTPPPPRSDRYEDQPVAFEHESIPVLVERSRIDAVEEIDWEMPVEDTAVCLDGRLVGLIARAGEIENLGSICPDHPSSTLGVTGDPDALCDPLFREQIEKRAVRDVHLKIGWMEQESVERVARCAREWKVERVYLTFEITRKGALDPFADMENVNALRLIGKDPFEGTLSRSGAFPGLVELDIEGAHVTGAFLRKLAPPTRLRVLDVAASQLIDEDLAIIGRNPDLEVLSVSALSVSRETFLEIAELVKLRQLDISYTPATDESFQMLSGLSRLEYLSVRETDISDESLEQIGRLGELETLRVSGSEITVEGLEHLTGLENLEVLDLRGLAIGDGELDHLCRIEHLRSLDLSETDVTDAGIASLVQCDSLASLRLTRNPEVTDGALCHLVETGELEKLDLADTHITDEGLKAISGIVTLVELSLSGTLVTDAGLKHLAGMPELERLSLLNCAVTWAGVCELEQSNPDIDILVMLHGPRKGC